MDDPILKALAIIRESLLLEREALPLKTLHDDMINRIGIVIRQRKDFISKHQGVTDLSDAYKANADSVVSRFVEFISGHLEKQSEAKEEKTD